jgi:hypothetical protein
MADAKALRRDVGVAERVCMESAELGSMSLTISMVIADLSPRQAY